MERIRDFGLDPAAHGTDILAMAFAPATADARAAPQIALAGGGSVTVFDFESRRRVCRFEGLHPYTPMVAWPEPGSLTILNEDSRLLRLSLETRGTAGAFGPYLGTVHAIRVVDSGRLGLFHVWADDEGWRVKRVDLRTGGLLDDRPAPPPASDEEDVGDPFQGEPDDRTVRFEDGQTLYVAWAAGHLQTFDSATEATLVPRTYSIREFSTRGSAPKCLAVSVAHRRVAIARGGQLELFRLPDLHREYGSTGHISPVKAIAFCPRDRYLASCDGNELSVWRRETAERVWTTEVFLGGSLAFSPDGNHLLVGGRKVASCYDAASGDLLERDRDENRYRPDQAGVSCGWTRDGRALRVETVKRGGLVRATRSRVVLHDGFDEGESWYANASTLYDDERPPLLSPSATHAAFLEDGTRAAVSGRSAPELHLWDLQRRRLLWKRELPAGRDFTLALFDDGGCVALARKEEHCSAVFFVFEGAVPDPVGLQVASSPNLCIAGGAKERLAIAVVGGVLGLALEGTGAKRQMREAWMLGLEEPATALAYSASGDHLAVGTAEGAVSLWKIPTPDRPQR